MRLESSVTSVSWIPSEAVTGAVLKGTFEAGFTHYDDPPPDELDDLEEMRLAGAFRFANHLAAWVEIEDGQIVDAGYSGAGFMGATSVRLANLRTTFEPVPLPDIRHEPEISDSVARFVQTTGGRTGLPRPASREAPAVRAVQSADGVDDARRSRFAPTARRSSRCSERASSPATGSTTTTDSSRRRSGSPTSRTGTATRSASTRRGASATRRRSSPRSRPRSNASSPPRSCARTRRPRSARSRKGKRLVRAGRVGQRPLPPPRRCARGAHRRRADRRSGSRRDPRRARGARRRDPHRRRSKRRPPCRVAVARPDQIDRAALLALAEKHRRETK